MDRKNKAFPINSFKASSANEGEAELIVSVFGVIDSYEERMVLGCFAESIQRKKPKGVWSHQWDQPVAKTLEIKELPPDDPLLPDEIKSQGGLWVKAKFNLETQRGRDAYSDLKGEFIDEFSIGYFEEKTRRGKDGILDILQVDLVEWSPVLRGANPATLVIGIKEGKQGRAAERNRAAHLLTAAQRKSQYLGRYAEGSAMISAIYSLCDDLFWHCLYDNLYDELEEDETVDDRISVLEAAFAEFSSISLKIIRAIMTLEEGAETMDEAAKSVRLLWPEPIPDSADSRVSSAFNQQIETARAAVDACITRADAIQALRTKEQRSLSPKRQEQLGALKVSLEALLSRVTPADTEAMRLQIEAEFLRLKAQTRPQFRV